MKREDLLHLFGPYLPTDRFRALLREGVLPTVSDGAALLVDIVGFTPMVTRLVTEFGAERACDELKRRLNPMFEVMAGQVFHHGGSVIRFTGDGFIAWFDDHPIGQDVESPTPAALRAISAGREMQEVMPLFRGLELRVCIGVGSANRWVVGQPEHGLVDLLSGPAVDAMNSLAVEAMPGQVVVHHDAVPWLRSEGVGVEINETDNAVVLSVPVATAQAARRHRWSAWAAGGDLEDTLNAVRPFVVSIIRERVENGFGDFVAELRYALPMFIRIGGPKLHQDGAQAILHDYVCKVQDILAASGGRLVSVEASDKGSVIMAVFGAPITYGDDAERAVRAAMLLRDMTAANEAITSQRIGVSRGMLYAGTVGGEVRREYSTIGDETNLAARLMSAAAPEQILVSSAVWEAVGSRLVFRDLPPVTVKGRSKPIPVVEPIAFQSGSQQQAYIGQIIGREPEVRQITELIEDAQAGTPAVLSIEGRSGIGKSRLIAEIVRLHSPQNVRIAIGDCVNTGRSNAYLPWRNLLLALFSPDDPDGLLLHLTEIVTRDNPSWLPRLPLLKDILGVPAAESAITWSASDSTPGTLDEQARRRLLFALVGDLLFSYARQQPIMLILEDAHWMDRASEALTMELAQQMTRRMITEPVPLLMALVYRPQGEADNPPELLHTIDDVRIHKRLVVDELNRAQVTTVMESYLRTRVPSDLANFVYERARGNPFFVQEVLDALLGAGHIHMIGNLVVVNDSLQAANLPRTVQGLVLARVDRLNELDKLVLKVASVIGNEFSVRVLAHSLPVDMDYDGLLMRLRALEERDFTRLQTAEPELVYAFSHAITQKVTYQSLLLAQRQTLHQSVASALQSLFPDAIAQLAYHFARSGDSRQARHYLMLAGYAAARRYANAEALSNFVQAAAFAETNEDHVEISRQRLMIMARLGDAHGMRAELPHLEHLAESRADWRAISCLMSATYFAQMSDWPHVIRDAQIACNLIEDTDDDLSWDAQMLLHRAFMGLYQREEADHVRVVIELLTERLHDPKRAVEVNIIRCESLFDEEPERALAEMKTAQGEAARLGDPVLEAKAWAAFLRLCLRANDYPSALDAAYRALELARQIGDKQREGVVLNQLGIVLVHLGQFSEGNTILLDAYKILHSLGDRVGEAISFVYLGFIAENYKANDEALAYMQRALAIQRMLQLDGDMALTLFHIGNVYIAKDDYGSALSCLDEARVLLLANNLPRRMEEIYSAISEIEIQRLDLAATRTHIDALIPRLAAHKLTDLAQPGLAYWRTIRVLEKCAEMENARRLRSAFRSYANDIRDRLTTPEWRATFINNLWYHAALFSEAQPD